MYTLKRLGTSMHALSRVHTGKDVILIAFLGYNVYTNAPQQYVIRTWPVFLILNFKIKSTMKSTIIAI